jgi:hypothetical protein
MQYSISAPVGTGEPLDDGQPVLIRELFKRQPRDIKLHNLTRIRKEANRILFEIQNCHSPCEPINGWKQPSAEPEATFTRRL